MSCGSFQLWIVSDDHEERRRAHNHASECSRCREVLIGQRSLRDHVDEWAASFEPPADLEEKVRRRIADKGRAPVQVESSGTSTRNSPGRPRLWIALAASLLLGIGLGVLELPAKIEAPRETRRLLNAGDLEIARQEEAAQIREIAELERQVSPLLAATSAEDLGARQAAILMEYRSRLATLDVTIGDVRGFVAQNPGHPRARSMLLDAYKEKKHVLREVIALEEETS